MQKEKNNLTKELQKKIEIGTVTKQDILENQVRSIYLGIGSNLGNKKNTIEKTKFELIQNNMMPHHLTRIQLLMFHHILYKPQLEI